MPVKEHCAFCQIIYKEKQRILAQNTLAFAIRDGYPVSAGHSLIIPCRHAGSFFEISSDERKALFELLDKVKIEIDKRYSPDAYNIGINDGMEAGQTLQHIHIHLIPRYQGDIDDPRGGIRWLFPHKAQYW